MKTRVQELLQIGDQLYSKRFPLLTLWQSFAENFYPLRADMTRSRYISEEFASYLMTGRPVLAHRELANALSSILRPRGMQWFQPKTAFEEINEDQACKVWLERAGATMRRVMYDRASQFTRATKEGDADYILFGQCVIEPRLNAQRTGLLYRTWHLRDCVWAENAELAIDQIHRKWKLEARALARLYPDTVSPEVKTRAEKDPFTEINCRVIVLPADEYDCCGKDDASTSPDPSRSAQDGTPRGRGGNAFIQIVIDEDHQTILEETPRPELGYVIPRWITIGGFSQYAYSPTAIVALPDARMLQQMTLTLIEIGQKIVDPPMIAVGDAIQGGTNLYAGAINWVDPDYDERTGEVLRPITLNGEGLQWGTEYVDKIELKSTKPPPDTATPEQVAAWRTEHGLPESAAAYVDGLELGDGTVTGEAEKALLASFAEQAMEGHWTAAQYNQAVGWYFDLQDRMAAQRDHTDGTFKHEASAELMREWGHDYAVNRNAIAQFFDRNFPADFKDALLTARLPDGSVLANHPTFNRAILDVAKTINPSSTMLPNASGGGLSNVESRIAEIEGKYMRATHGSDPWKSYWTGEAGARMQQEYRGLLASREQGRRGRTG
jgi:Bacteriophage head to tail connecting protein